jgi:inositol phosphorylceramide mannosyltransferase catalytic subunit
MHPEYEYKFWTDSDCVAFITREYPQFLSTFVNYPYNIQRADAIRYFLLAHYGGIYIDLDNGCNRRLDPMLQFPAWVHLTKPTGISNDGMGAAPGHPFFLYVIDQLQRYNRSWVLPYITVMATTGPLFLSLAWKRYTGLHATDSVASAAQVWVLSPEQYFQSDTAFFDLNYGGSSWHNGDAKFLLWMGENLLAVIVAGLTMVAVMGICFWWARRRSFQPRRTRESSSAEPASSRWQPHRGFRAASWREWNWRGEKHAYDHIETHDS